MGTGGGRSRLTLVNLDSGEELVVQHDPARLRLQDGATWHPRGQVERPGLEYERGRPATLSLRLVVDTSRSRGDVGAAGVDALRALLERVEVEEDGQAVRRPPHLLVRWGRLELACVLTELDIAYVLFRSDGSPVRAEVDLVLTEHEGQRAEAPASGRATSPPGGERAPTLPAPGWPPWGRGEGRPGTGRPTWAVEPLPAWPEEGW